MSSDAFSGLEKEEPMDWKRKYSLKSKVFDYKQRLLSRRTRAKSLFDETYPIGIYIFFWFTLLLDFGSTIFTTNMIPQHRWLEANPLFYALKPLPFFAVSVFTNTFLFMMVMYHQTVWKRGTIFLVISIAVHGFYGVNNLVQILSLQI